MNRIIISKLIICLIGATAISTTACKNRKTVIEAESAVGATPNQINTSDSLDGSTDPLSGDTSAINDTETKNAAGDSLAMEFSKTPCYGQCPVYTVRVFESGFAIWEGKNFTERMGTYSTRISAVDRQKFYAEAEAQGFYDFDRTYDNPVVQDLPSSSLMINADEERHRVTIRMGVPKEVKDYFENAQAWFEDRDWQPYE